MHRWYGLRPSNLFQVFDYPVRAIWEFTLGRVSLELGGTFLGTVIHNQWGLRQSVSIKRIRVSELDHGLASIRIETWRDSWPYACPLRQDRRKRFDPDPISWRQGYEEE